MSFVGQFRPTWQRRPGAGDLLLFSAGHLSAAGLGVALLHETAGVVTVRALSSPLRAGLALAVAALLAVSDHRRVRRGVHCSIGPRRQTPRRLGVGSPLGVVLWGLDTGLPVTTVRATALPLVGIALVALGFGARWVGLAYGLGFLAVLWAACALPRPAGRAPADEPQWVVMGLLRAQGAARATVPVLVALAGAGLGTVHLLG